MGYTDAMKRVYIMNAPDAMRSCVAGWRDVFSLADRERGALGLARLFELSLISHANRASAAPAPTPAPDILLVPASLSGTFPVPEPGLLRTIREWHATGTVIGSACAGSFLLAAAGLLDGREATTHWSLAIEFRARFPSVRLKIERMLVDLGDIVTGGGVTAYLDVALRLIARYGGIALAERCARILLFDTHRLRQTVYEETDPRLVPALHGDEDILRAEAWMEPRLFTAATVGEWAAGSGLGLRSFERRFRAAMGQSPGEYVRKRRLDRARELLAATRRTWEEIASDCGYRDAGAFRRLFIARYGIGPRDYRSRFSRSDDASR